MSTILVTGANRGIGLSLSRALLARNHRVIATARVPAQAEVLRRAAAVHPADRFALIELDVRDPRSVEGAAARVAEFTDHLDVLINNAGVFPETGDESFSDFDLALLEQAFSVNVLGTARITQALLPLVRRGDHPRIINISSGAASITTKTDARRYAYGPSKSALNMFTRTLASELSKEGVIVTAISPGWVRTEMGGADADLDPDDTAAELALTIERLDAQSVGQFLDRHGNTGVYHW